MSESLKKLKEIPVVNKIMQELDRSLGVKDKILAEFILDIAKKCSSVAEFEKELISNEAEFSIDLVNTIYATATRMLPEHFKTINVGQKETNNVEEHFNKGKMLIDEPEKALHEGGHHHH